MYFDAAVVFVTNFLLLFRLAMAILCVHAGASDHWASLKTQECQHNPFAIYIRRNQNSIIYNIA